MFVCPKTLLLRSLQLSFLLIASLVCANVAQGQAQSNAAPRPKAKLVAFKAHLEKTKVAEGVCEIYSYPICHPVITR